MSDFDLETLTSPLARDAPCGGDLEYDPTFIALQAVGAAKPERQYGDTLIAAQGPDWPSVHEKALQLAKRTRDLRLAVWLVRSSARLGGLGTATQALQLARTLLESYWDYVHPQLDGSDGNDPTARLNALIPLVHPAEGLADLRAARLMSHRASVCVRDIELAFGRAEPLPGETVPTEEGVLHGVRAALTASPELRARMLGAAEAAQGIAAVIDRRLGTDSGLQFAPLLWLLECVAEAARRVPVAVNGATTDRAGSDPATVAALPQRSNPIVSRESAMQALDGVCEWIEKNEPSHPAPLLIRRAQRLMNKGFIDIMRDLAPDGLSQVHKLAGTQE